MVKITCCASTSITRYRTINDNTFFDFGKENIIYLQNPEDVEAVSVTSQTTERVRSTLDKFRDQIS